MAEPETIQVRSSVRSSVRSTDDQSRDTRWSLWSLSNSISTYSTGLRSLEGATWRQDLVLTMNSGFGLGSRRIGEHGGDKEGREREGFFARIRGVVRTGRGPIAVPASKMRALLGGKSAEDNARLDTVPKENDSAAAAEEERRVAAVEEKRVLREAIKNEVEKSCEIPYRDERSLYRLAAEDGSDESITAMAEQILQKLAEAQQFVGEKQRKADSTVDEEEWYRTLNVESTQETRYINEILNFDEYYPRLEAAEVRLRRFCFDIKGELMSKRVIGFRETRCCIKEPLPGYAFRGLGSHLDNSHALQPVERTLPQTEAETPVYYRASHSRRHPCFNHLHRDALPCGRQEMR